MIVKSRMHRSLKNAIDMAMSNKILVGGAAAIVIIVLMALTFSMLGHKAPSVSALRADPALFQLDDYEDKVALHTRLSTLFPRGTARSVVDEFMRKAGFTEQQNDGQRCTYSTDFGTMRFIYGLNDDRLISVHILENEQIWPDFRESCIAAAQELTPTSPQNETPIILPLEPLDIER